MEIKLHNLENKNTKKITRKWECGLGNCHAYLMLRKDMVEHLKTVHEETGIKYLRFHGLFDDDMNIIQRMSDYSYYSKMPFSRSIREYNFLNVKKVLDNVLETGFKPFVELSFMPSALAKKKKYGLRYKNNNSMPKSLEEYSNFIKDFINFLLENYGKEEIETWFFEVWNEPDLKIFFNGSKNDYLKLYETAFKAIKSICPSLKVGGPSTSKCKWLKDFANYGETHNAKPDFISTHHYVGDAFGNVFSYKECFKIMKNAYLAKKNNYDITAANRLFFYHKDFYKNWPLDVFKKMDNDAKKEVPNYPLYITEWNTMGVFGSPYMDDKVNASFIIHYALDMDESIEGAFYWCASDLFEESFMLNLPFHGGFGIINNVGIPKPSFYAFKILHNLYDDEIILDSNKVEDIEYHVFKKDNKLQVLVFNTDFDIDKNENHLVNLSLDEEIKSIYVYKIDNDHVNPAKEWKKLGKKKLLTDDEISKIKELSTLKKEEVKISDDSSITFNISSNSINLFEIELNHN